MTDKTQDRFKVLARAVEINAPEVVIGHMAMAVAIRAFGCSSSMELARYIVQYNKECVDYAFALLDPHSAESLEVAEIEKMMDDVELDDAALRAAYDK